MIFNIIGFFILLAIIFLIINVLIWVNYQMLHLEYTKYVQKVWLIATGIIFTVIFILGKINFVTFGGLWAGTDRACQATRLCQSAFPDDRSYLRKDIFQYLP